MMTNEEWLKSLDTEEFANILNKFLDSGGDYICNSYGLLCPCNADCLNCVLTWLKQERQND